jgi:CheY-like chemotaxis protein
MYKLDHTQTQKKIISEDKRKVFKILIVDDEKESAEMFKEILELRGHNITLLNEGMDCIAKCKNKTFDIIFLDYHIGDIDGVEVADIIKDLFKNTSSIFAYTGDSTTDAINKFKETGMTGALIKPVDTDLLDQLMNSLEERGCIDKNIVAKLTRNFKNNIYLF